MKISGADIAALAKNVAGLELFARWTPTKIDDFILRVLKTIAEDRVLLDQLAEWLSYVPVFAETAEAGSNPENPEPSLPRCLLNDRAELEAWRTFIQTHLPECDENEQCG